MHWLLLLSACPLFATVRILTFHCNRPSFIEWQQKTLNQFLQEEYELIVFNDGPTPEMAQSIQHTCQRLSIQCIRYQPEWHLTDPLNTRIQSWIASGSIICPHFTALPTLNDIISQGSVRHCHLLQYAMNHFGYQHDDILIIMDGDAFLTRELSIRKQLQQYDLIAMTASCNNIRYPWVPFLAFDPSKLPDMDQMHFQLAVIDNYMHDTASELYEYLQAHPTVKTQLFPSEYSDSLSHLEPRELKTLGLTHPEIWLIKNMAPYPPIEFSFNRSVLHFRDGKREADWNTKRSDILQFYLSKVLM